MSLFTDAVQSTVSLQIIIPSDSRPDFSTQGTVAFTLDANSFSVTALTASTTHTLVGATPIVGKYSIVTVTNAQDSVALPTPSFIGQEFVVQNVSSTSGGGQIYANGATINGTVGTTGIVLPASATTRFLASSLTTFITL